MFTVVIPVWNKGHTLLRTLESVFAQSRRDFEIVLVDDGSTDDSLKVVESCADPRLRIVAAPSRGGPGAARNLGIEAARHDWVAFLDADDLWLPWHLEELERVRSRFPEAGLIATSYVDSDRKGRFVLPDDSAGEIDSPCLFDCLGSGARTFWTSVSAIPKRVHAEMGGFGPFTHGEDNEYWTRIALRRPVARSTRVTAVYVHGTGGLSDRAVERWRDRELRATSDLSPAVALLLERYESLGEATRRGIDRFIEIHLDWCLRFYAGRGNVAMLRTLAPLYRHPPPRAHRLLLAGARLPDPIARLVCRAALSLVSRLRP